MVGSRPRRQPGDMNINTITPGAVVVGYSGERDADHALAWAAEQAALENRPLALVHVLRPAIARHATGRQAVIAFAVVVGCEVDGISSLDFALQFGNELIFALANFIDRAKIIVNINANFTLGQIAHMAHTRHNAIASTQIFLNSFCFGWRLNNHQFMIHRVFLKSSHYATNRRIQNAANQFKVDVYWGSVALGGLVEARSGIRAA